jgi:hypothetical protein
MKYNVLGVVPGLSGNPLLGVDGKTPANYRELFMMLVNAPETTLDRIRKVVAIVDAADACNGDAPHLELSAEQVVLVNELSAKCMRGLAADRLAAFLDKPLGSAP